MTLFRLKKGCGNHIEKNKKGNLVTYTSKPGSNLIESDRDLIAISPSKFELVQEQVSKGGVATAPKIPDPSKKKGKAKVTTSKVKTSENEHGVDVTSEFPIASKVEFKVFEKSNWFTVIDPDDNEVMNEKKLRRDKVEAFLTDYLKDDDEDDTDDEDENEDDTDDEDNDEDDTNDKDGNDDEDNDDDEED